MIVNIVLGIGVFFENFFQSMLSLAKVLLMSSFNLPKFLNQKPTASILGNGPSLNQSLEESLAFIKETDIYCVNNFASSSIYTAIKPQNYVMLDPAYFLYSAENSERKDIEKTLEAILSLTDWNMKIFFPAKHRNSYLVNEIRKAKPTIQICFFNYTIVRGFVFFRNWFFKHNLGMPQCQNIMGACIYVALVQNYSTIYLFGADHSWHEEIRITEQNELEMRQVHFYDNTSNTKYQKVVDVRDNTKPKLHSQFLSLHKAFFSYEILNTFAEYRNTKILNASKKSYIDTFERISL